MSEQCINGYGYANKLENYLANLGPDDIKTGYANLLEDHNLTPIVFNSSMLQDFGFDITERGILKKILENTVFKCPQNVKQVFAHSVDEMKKELLNMNINIDSLKTKLTSLTNQIKKEETIQKSVQEVKKSMSKFVDSHPNCDVIQYNNALAQANKSNNLIPDQTKEILSNFLLKKSNQCLNDLKITLNSSNVAKQFYTKNLNDSLKTLGIDVSQIASSPEHLETAQQKLKLVNVLLNGSSNIQNSKELLELKESFKKINDLEDTQEMAVKLDELLKKNPPLEKKDIMKNVEQLKLNPPAVGRKKLPVLKINFGYGDRNTQPHFNCGKTNEILNQSKPLKVIRIRNANLAIPKTNHTPLKVIKNNKYNIVKPNVQQTK